MLSHVLADLSEDAIQAFGQVTGHRMSDYGPDHLHDSISARLGAAGRMLRSESSDLSLHAAMCVLSDGTGVLLPGATRAGKSSLVSLLGAERAAQNVSDDFVWISNGWARGMGAPIALRPGSPLWAVARGLWYADQSSRLMVRPIDLGAPDSVVSGQVDAILFPAFCTDGEAEVRFTSPAQTFCRLTTSLLRASNTPDLMELANLAGKVPAAVITYSDRTSALDMVDTATRRAPATASTVSWLDDDEITRSGLRLDVYGMRFDDDVALWHPNQGQIVCVESWPGSRLRSTPLWDDLHKMGFTYEGEG